MACDGCARRNVQRRALQLVIKSGFHVQKHTSSPIRFTVKKEALEKISSRTFTHSGWLQVQAQFAKNSKYYWPTGPSLHRVSVLDIERVRRSVRHAVDVYVPDYDDYDYYDSEDEDSEPIEPFQCAQCSFLEKVNYQLTTIIGSEIGKFMSDAVFLEFDAFRLETLYYEHNVVPHGRQLQNNSVRVMTDFGYPGFTEDDYDAIVKFWNVVHHMMGPEDAKWNLTDTMWAVLGIPVQVFWDPESDWVFDWYTRMKLWSSLRIYNLRIRCTQLCALTVEHLRQATWAKVSDELADIEGGWEVTELFFRVCPRCDFDKWRLDKEIGTGPLLGFDEKDDVMFQDLIRNGCVRFKLEGVRHEQ